MLQQGQRYPIRVRHQQSGGPDYLTVAVRILNTSSLKTPEEARYQSVRERQLIQFTTTVVREIQQLVISNVIGGTFSLVGAPNNPISITSTDVNPFIAALRVVYPSCSSFVF